MSSVMAIDRARRIFTQGIIGVSFEDALQAHLQHGFVFSRPDVFLLLRPVRHDADPLQIIDPWHVFKGNVDCWHIYALAGNMQRAWEFCPCELPWISYERQINGRNCLHIRAFCTMLDKTIKSYG